MKKINVAPACRFLGALTIFFSLNLPAALAQARWMDLAPFPEPHVNVIGQAANDKMYVFAGLVSAPGYDPAKDSWRTPAPITTKRGAGVAATNSRSVLDARFPNKWKD